MGNLILAAALRNGHCEWDRCGGIRRGLSTVARRFPRGSSVDFCGSSELVCVASVGMCQRCDVGVCICVSNLFIFVNNCLVNNLKTRFVANREIVKILFLYYDCLCCAGPHDTPHHTPHPTASLRRWCCSVLRSGQAQTCG